MKTILCSTLAAGLAFSMVVAAGATQSLAEAARKEAERRRQVDQQGIPERRIDAADGSRLAPGGAISLSSPGPGTQREAAAPPKPAGGAGLRAFQTKLQKLDRDIQQSEAQLKKLKERQAAERWAPVARLGVAKGAGPANSEVQLGRQIQDLEGKLKLWRQERMDTFQAGRKAGFLPGELERRGVIRQP